MRDRYIRHDQRLRLRVVAPTVAIGALLLVNVSSWASTYSQFFIDDTYIHLTYAERFLSGDFFRFNVNESPVFGTSSPLWNAVLTLPVFLNPEHPLPGVKVLSAILGILLVLGLLFVGLAIRPSESKNRDLTHRLLPTLLGLSPLLATGVVWQWFYSGMEIPLFMIMYVAFIYRFIRMESSQQQSTRDLILMILVTCGIVFSRPEGVALPGLGIGYLLISRRVWEGINEHTIAAIKYTAVMLGIGAAWLLYSLNSFGSVIPLTVSAKGASSGLFSGSSFDSFTQPITRIGEAHLILGASLTVCLIVVILIQPKRFVKWVSRPLNLLNIGFVAIVLAGYIALNGELIVRVVPIFSVALVILNISLLNEAVTAIQERYSGSGNYLNYSMGVFSVLVIAGGLVQSINVDDRHEALTKRYTNLREMAQLVSVQASPPLTSDDWILLETLGVVSYSTEASIIDIAGLISPEFTEVSHLLGGTPDTGGTYIQLQRNRIREQVLEKRPRMLILKPIQKSTFINGIFTGSEVEFTELDRTDVDATGSEPFVVWQIDYRE